MSVSTCNGHCSTVLAYLVCSELDTRFWHDLDDVDSITCIALAQFCHDTITRNAHLQKDCEHHPPPRVLVMLAIVPDRSG